MLDIFKGDPFKTVQMTDAFIKAPYKPGLIGKLGLFTSKGIRSTTAVVEYKEGQLALIQTSERGAPPTQVAKKKSKIVSFVVPHLEKDGTLRADEFQGVRQFGSEDEEKTVENSVRELQSELKSMHEVTLEYHRVNALKGIVKDADGSDLANFFTSFNVAQQTYELDLTSDAHTVRRQCVEVTRLCENELGAEPVDGEIALCGDEFFDNLIDAESVRDTLSNQESKTLREDLRQGFKFGGILFINYRGGIGGTPFIADDEAYVVPNSPIFKTYYGPADFMEAVNTIGLPYYSKLLEDPSGRDAFVTVHSQSNPLCLNLRPRAVVKMTLST